MGKTKQLRLFDYYFSNLT